MQDGFTDATQPGGVGIEVVWTEEDLEVAQHVQHQKEHHDQPGNGHDRLLTDG